MILRVISEHISIDELQKEDEKKYVHLLSRPLQSLGDFGSRDSVIYTTKSIARAVKMRHPGILHLFSIVECNQPFDIKLADGKFCRVVIFENSGLAGNLAFYFKGENCTVLYTGYFTRCRALLLNKLLHKYVVKGIDVMYVDNTAVRSVDPVSVYSASATILQIAKKYPDHQIVMNVPPFGYEDLIFSLANVVKLKVFVEGVHLLAFEKHQIIEIFEKDSQKAKVVIKEEDVTLETIAKRFIERKLITLRILLCELPPKNYYENIGLFEIHWSPHPSLFEIYTLLNYINPKNVMEIDSMPKLPSFIKKESTNNNNFVADNFRVGVLSGRSTPVSQIEELSASVSCIAHNNRRKGQIEVCFQNQSESFVQNNIARMHNFAWKYYNLPKRMPRGARRAYKKNAKVELNMSKDGEFSNDIPSVSTFSSLDFSVESKTDEKNRENDRLISSTPKKGGNDHHAKSVITSNNEDSSHDIPSVSTFSSLSSVESDFSLNDEVNEIVSQTIDAPTIHIAQVGQMEEKSLRHFTKSKKQKSKKNAEGKPFILSDKEDSSYDIPSISTFSSLFSSVENDWDLTDQVSGLISQTHTSRTGTTQSKQIVDKAIGDEKAYKKNANVEMNMSKDGEFSNDIPSVSTFSSLDFSVESKKDEKSRENYRLISSTPRKGGNDHHAKSVITSNNEDSSHDIPSVSTFSSLSSVESDFSLNDEVNEIVSQTIDAPTIHIAQVGQMEEKSLRHFTKSKKQKSKKNAEGKPFILSDKEDSSYDIPSISTFSSLFSSVENDWDLTDQVSGLISQTHTSRTGTTQSKQIVDKAIGDEKGNQAKVVVISEAKENQSSNEFPSITTFSSLSTSAERNPIRNDLINEVVSRVNINLSQGSKRNVEKVKIKQKSVKTASKQAKSKNFDLKNRKKSVKNALKDSKKGNQVLEVTPTKGNHQISFEFPCISTAIERNSMWNDLINEVVSQIDMNLSRYNEKYLDNKQNNKCEEALKNGDQSIKNTSMRNKKDDETNKVTSQTPVKPNLASSRIQNRSKINGQDADHIRRKHYEQKAWKHSAKPVKKDETVKIGNETYGPYKIVGTGRTEKLLQVRSQNAGTVRNKYILKKSITKTKDTSKKYGRDLEEDEQVVPNGSDGIDSDTPQEFMSCSNLLSDDTLSISTFTSLSLTSLSDVKPTPGKSRKMSKKKKNQCRKTPKPRSLEAKLISGIVATNDYGQLKETKEKKSIKSISKLRRLKKKQLGKSGKW